MENHRQLSQRQGTYRCGDNDGPAKNERRAPRRSGSDADKVVNAPSAADVPAISPGRDDMGKEAAQRRRSTDGEIWPKEPPDTD
jgi:hypothetical protein